MSFVEELFLEARYLRFSHDAVASHAMSPAVCVQVHG